LPRTFKFTTAWRYKYEELKLKMDIFLNFEQAILPKYGRIV